MGRVTTHKQWMDETSSLLHSRSYLLTKVDEAVLKHDGSPDAYRRGQIAVALDMWINDQRDGGKDWRKSVRNEKGAVARLKRAVSNPNGRALKPDEREALQVIVEHQANALRDLFEVRKLEPGTGAEVVSGYRTVEFKQSTVIGQWRAAKTGLDRLESGLQTTLVEGMPLAATGAKAGRSLAKMPERIAAVGRGGAQGGRDFVRADYASMRPQIVAFIRSLCPAMDPQQVFDALRLGSVEKFIVNMSPLLGMISSGGKAIIGWTQVAVAVWGKFDVMDKRNDIRAGNPLAAFDALMQLIEREIASESTKAGAATAAFIPLSVQDEPICGML